VISAVIFDMDGLLVDSEPTWRAVEIEVFGALGLRLTEEECASTTGLRIDDVVRFRRAQGKWADADDAVVERIVDRMVDEARRNPRPKPGVAHALSVVAQAKLPVAIASSSPYRLIRAVVETLKLPIELVHSAEEEPYGKPHPGVYLTTAKRLGVPPEQCLAVEDSLNGVLAAKSARMRCVAVPESDDPRFVIADRILPSLAEFSLEA
jgi:mannitol-1-/sugar-/sorbitol-6-/2-deoxyglucose-6-phosphatase